MESLQAAIDWILGIVIILFVPALVWVAVIVGLISIVRDKAHREEIAFPEPSLPRVCTRVCGEHRSDRSSVRPAGRDPPEWATPAPHFGLKYQSESKDLRKTQAIHLEKELKP